MYRIFFVFTLLLSLFHVLPAQSFLWGAPISGSDYQYADRVAVAPNGDVVVAGSFSGTTDFDPSSGVVNLPVPANGDLYVERLDSSGNLLWVKGIYGTMLQNVTEVAIDPAGCTYLGGQFRGTIDTDPGSGTANLTAPNDWDLFLIKLDPNGNFLWSKQWVSPTILYMSGLVAAPNGAVYLTGRFLGTLDLDPDAGVSNAVSNGNFDPFMIKLNSNGSFAWGNSFGGPGDETIQAFTLDSDYNLVTGGSFKGLSEFDPGPGSFTMMSQPSGLSDDIFISKYDSSGNFLWAKGMGSLGNEYCHAVVTDVNNNIYFGGRYALDSLDLDPGPGVFYVYPNGADDLYLAKLYSDGNFGWAGGFGGASYENLTTLSISEGHFIYAAGYFNSTMDLDPVNPNAGLITPVGQSDVYVWRVDTSGSVDAVGQLGGSMAETCWGSAASQTDNSVFFSFQFSGTIDASPLADVQTFTSQGLSDGMVIKLGQCFDPSTPVFSASPYTVCTGDSLRMEVVGGNLNSASDWMWYEGTCGGMAVDSGIGIDILPVGNTTYYVRGEGGCITPGGVCATVNVQLVPALSGFMSTQADPGGCQGSATVTPLGGTPPFSIQWDAAAGSQTGQTATNLCPGTYCVTVTDSLGCTWDTCGIDVLIGVGGDMENALKLYPNPASNQVTLELGAHAQVRLVDLGGRIIWQSEMEAGRGELDLSDLPQGLYGLEVEFEGGAPIYRRLGVQR